MTLAEITIGKEEVIELFGGLDEEYDKMTGENPLMIIDASQGFEKCRNLCGEYLEANSNCPLINGERLCAKSLLMIEYNEKTNKYELFQFGIK